MTERLGGLPNNGATGMPNFHADLAGLCTRIGRSPSPHPSLGEVQVQGAYPALLPVRYDAALWHADFLAQWPAGSAAWLSHWQRISQGPAFCGRACAGGIALIFRCCLLAFS